MVIVRPTLRVLKELYKGKKLPAEAAKLYEAARTSGEEQTRLQLLMQATELACNQSAIVARRSQTLLKRSPGYSQGNDCEG